MKAKHIQYLPVSSSSREDDDPSNTSIRDDDDMDFDDKMLEEGYEGTPCTKRRFTAVGCLILIFTITSIILLRQGSPDDQDLLHEETLG